MTKDFVVDYTDWHGRRDTLFCHAANEARARAWAYWTLGDLIEIHSVQEYTDT